MLFVGNLDEEIRFFEQNRRPISMSSKTETRVLGHGLIRYKIEPPRKKTALGTLGSWLTERQWMSVSGCPITETKCTILSFHETILRCGEPGSLGQETPKQKFEEYDDPNPRCA